MEEKDVLALASKRGLRILRIYRDPPVVIANTRSEELATEFEALGCRVRPWHPNGGSPDARGWEIAFRADLTDQPTDKEELWQHPK